MDELPGIYNWILDEPDSDYDTYITNYDKNLPTLADTLEDLNHLVNPLGTWIQEEFDYYPDHHQKNQPFGSYLGYAKKGWNEKQEREIRERKSIYPTYQMWC